MALMCRPTFAVFIAGSLDSWFIDLNGSEFFLMGFPIRRWTMPFRWLEKQSKVMMTKIRCARRSKRLQPFVVCACLSRQHF